MHNNSSSNNNILQANHMMRFGGAERKDEMSFMESYGERKMRCVIMLGRGDPVRDEMLVLVFVCKCE